MILTASHIYRLACELKESILGWRVTEIFTTLRQPEVILHLRLQRRQRYLLLSAHPESCRAELLEKPRKEWERKSPLFSPIRGGQVRDIAQIDFDRAIQFEIARETEIGEIRKYRLILELTGLKANLILLDAKSARISQCLRIAKAGRRGSREIAPGRSYSPMPKGTRLSPLDLDSQRLSCLARKEPSKILKSLLGSETWGVNDSIIGEIIARSGAYPRARAGDLSKKELVALSGAIEQLYSLSAGRREKATVVLDQKGEPEELLFYTPTGMGEKPTRNFPSLLEAVTFFYLHFMELRELQREWTQLARKLNTLIAKNLKRRERLQQKLSESRQKDLYKIYGDLLMLYPEKKKRGGKEITVDNIFETPPEKVTISLDPKLSILENARWYYRRFRKAASGEKVLEAQLQKADSNMEILRRAKKNLESEPGKAVLSNLKAKLAALGLVGAVAFEVKRGPKTKVQTRFHPREFVTTDGWKVLVGRNDRENDHLTFKIASREDIWFHARQAHGSHVVLKRPSQRSQPSKRSIEEAASLAAYFSKQRTSRKVSVSYTLVKHLRKPKKAKAGLVLVQQEKSILVEPQPLSPAEPSETTDDQPEQLTHR